MKNKLIAQRYAKAVLDNIPAESYDKLIDDIKHFQEILKKDPEIIDTIHAKLLPLNARLEIVALFQKDTNLGKVWEMLFKLLVKKHRFNIIESVLTEMFDMILAERHEVKVLLSVARKQSDDTLNQIQTRLEKLLNKKVMVDIALDESIIGGFIANANGLIIDGSIRYNLERFKAQRIKR